RYADGACQLPSRIRAHRFSAQICRAACSDYSRRQGPRQLDPRSSATRQQVNEPVELRAEYSAATPLFQSSDVASRALSKFPGWMRARAAHHQYRAATEPGPPKRQLRPNRTLSKLRLMLSTRSTVTSRNSIEL